jgi:hypothetical protein
MRFGGCYNTANVMVSGLFCVDCAFAIELWCRRTEWICQPRGLFDMDLGFPWMLCIAFTHDLGRSSNTQRARLNLTFAINQIILLKTLDFHSA